MKLILKKDRLVVWPTDFSLAADGGKVDKFSLNVTYKLIANDEVARLMTEGKALNGDSDTPVIDAVVQHIEGLGIQDDNGNPVPFTRELLPDICRNTSMRVGLINGFFECVGGAVEKNV